MKTLLDKQTCLFTQKIFHGGDTVFTQGFQTKTVFKQGVQTKIKTQQKKLFDQINNSLQKVTKKNLLRKQTTNYQNFIFQYKRNNKL